MLNYATITTTQELFRSEPSPQTDKDAPLINYVLITPMKQIARREQSCQVDKPRKFRFK